MTPDEQRLAENTRRRVQYVERDGRVYSRTRAQRVRAERVPILNKIKVDRGCADCGYNAHPAALHFDHRDPSQKSFTIAKCIAYRWENLLAEIAKCDVRCANCHAIRSIEEGHVGRPHIGPDEGTPAGDGLF